MGIISGEGDIRKAHNCCSHWDKQRYDEIRKQTQQEVLVKFRMKQLKVWDKLLADDFISIEAYNKLKELHQD